MGRLVEDGLVEQPVEGHAEKADRDDGNDERGGEAAGLVGQQQADIGAQREDAGMGDVQDPEQAVDQRQADGDQGIDTALDQPLNQKIGIVQRGEPRSLKVRSRFNESGIDRSRMCRPRETGRRRGMQRRPALYPARRRCAAYLFGGVSSLASTISE